MRPVVRSTATLVVVWLAASVLALGAARADDAGPGAAAPLAVPPDAGPAGAVAPITGVDAGAAADPALDPLAVPPDPVDAGVPLDAGAPVDALPPDAPPPDAAYAIDFAPVPPDAGPGDVGATVTPEPPAPEPPPAPTPLPTIGASRDPTPAKTTEARAFVVIKLVIGVVVLMVLAYLGGHKKVVRAQERLGISGVIAAGFPFLALGLIMRQPEIGVLTDDVLARLQPLLHFGLGWLGFIIGAQLDIRVLDKVPTGTAYLIVVEALAPFAVTAAACGGIMIAVGGATIGDPLFWRDILVLGAAAAMTAPKRFRGFAQRTWKEGRGVDHLLAQLDEIVGVIGLLFVVAYFRPDVSAGWQLPGTAWVFVTIGLGVVIGVLIFAMVRVPVSNAEFLAVVLGSIAFGAGLAGYLFLSPIVVCFLAGVLVTNFPCEQRGSIFKILNHLERPIHLLFLVIVGATWQVFDWRAWLLVPAFVTARVVGKWLGIFGARKTVGSALPDGYADHRALVTPVSALAIALVISLHGIDAKLVGLVDGVVTTRALWITTVVIGGAILTELLVSITTPPRPARARTAIPPLEVPTGVPLPPPDAPVAIDELDEPSQPTAVAVDAAPGPVYRDDDDEPPRSGGAGR